jgi:hypothetical protein
MKYNKTMKYNTGELVAAKISKEYLVGTIVESGKFSKGGHEWYVVEWTEEQYNDGVPATVQQIDNWKSVLKEYRKKNKI